MFGPSATVDEIKDLVADAIERIEGGQTKVKLENSKLKVSAYLVNRSPAYAKPMIRVDIQDLHPPDADYTQVLGLTPTT